MLGNNNKKFIFVLFNTPADPLSVKTRFASAVESTKRGAEGLCSATTNCFDDMGLSKEDLQSKSRVHVTVSDLAMEDVMRNSKITIFIMQS